MDNFLENYGWMIGLLVAMWLLQFFMSFLQMKRYYSRLSALPLWPRPLPKQSETDEYEGTGGAGSLRSHQRRAR